MSAFIAEVLEDRTLLSGVADDGGGESWAELLGSNESVIWLVPAESVAWIAGKGGKEEVAPGEGSFEAAGVVAEVVLQLDASANWHDVISQVDATSDLAANGSEVMVIVEWGAAVDSGRNFVTDELEATQWVNVIFRPMAEDFLSSSASPERTVSGLPSFNASVNGGIAQSGDELFPVGGAVTISGGNSPGIGSPLDGPAVTQDRTEPTTSPNASANEVLPIVRQQPFGLAEVSAASSQSLEQTLELAAIEPDATNFVPALFVSSMSGISTPLPTDRVAHTTGTGDSPELLESTVSVAAWHANALSGSSPVRMLVTTPITGLQAAAEPVIAVAETLLASLDTVARALLALFTGSSGGGESLVAPLVQPILESSPVVIDSQRPRWALHNGAIEELAAYSIVVAPDQHFDLKDFGPASRRSGHDPVVRIEFDLPPQHGQIVAGEVAGAFRYSADPGFSGVDAARFRVTRASGQSVAGSITIVVPEPGAVARPAAFRQVELPVGDPRVSDAAPDAIDASFRLSGVWLDLP